MKKHVYLLFCLMCFMSAPVLASAVTKSLDGAVENIKATAQEIEENAYVQITVTTVQETREMIGSYVLATKVFIRDIKLFTNMIANIIADPLGSILCGGLTNALKTAKNLRKELVLPPPSRRKNMPQEDINKILDAQTKAIKRQGLNALAKAFKNRKKASEYPAEAVDLIETIATAGETKGGSLKLLAVMSGSMMMTSGMIFEIEAASLSLNTLLLLIKQQQ